jgi:hypothetical protein
MASATVLIAYMALAQILRIFGANFKTVLIKHQFIMTLDPVLKKLYKLQLKINFVL